MRKLMSVLLMLGIFLVGTSVFADGVDEYTVLMLHCNGEDGSTDFPDDSFSNHTVTSFGNAQVDTAQKKLGSGSAKFDGSGDYLSIPNSSVFNFGSEDFTIDFWINVDETQAMDTAIINFGNTLGGPEDTNWVIYYGGSIHPSFVASTDGIDWDIVIPWNTYTQANTWQHLAITKSGNVYRTFTDGMLENSIINSNPIQDIDAPIEMGRWVRNTGTNYIDAWADEVRISKGIARWTSDFTPPTEEYNDIPNNLPLAHAGADAEAYVGEEVTLDGSSSYDPDWDIVSWVWRSLSDPQKPIVAEGETATMNAHGYAEELIELTVTDSHGATDSDTMIITSPVIDVIERLPQLKKKLQ